MPVGNAHLGDHPPKPRLALSVGVIGHRPNRLPRAQHERDRIAAKIGEVLDLLAKQAIVAREKYRKYFEGEPELALVSALAEGADRIAAHEAIARNFLLDAPLPFAQDVYEIDFVQKPIAPDDPAEIARAEQTTRKSIEEFQNLLAHRQTRSVLWLCGRRTPDLAANQPDVDAQRAYEAAGFTVLNQADLVVAVSDGKGSAGRGGTADLITTAVRMGLPIILIDPNKPADANIRWSGLDEYPISVSSIDDLVPRPINENTMNALVEALVHPPKDETECASLVKYFEGEYRGRIWWRPDYPLLTMMFGCRWLKLESIFPDPKPQNLATEYIGFAAPANGGDVGTIATAYAWADAVGVRFAQMFRSAFVRNFAFAALAVACAAASVVWHESKPYLVAAEFALIVLVVLNTSSGRRHRWHRLWFEAREVAERLRVAIPLWALGMRPVTFYTGDEPTWTGWYARAFVRMQCMRRGSLDTPGLLEARAVMAKFIEGEAPKKEKGLLEHQHDYNELTACRMHKLEKNLERFGRILFNTTATVAALYLLYRIVKLAMENEGFPMPAEASDVVDHVVTALSAGLPALATASYGIRVIGDFEGTEHRTIHTRATLAKLMAAIKKDELELHLLRARAQAAADAMLGDVEHWRLAAESRGLSIPG